MLSPNLAGFLDVDASADELVGLILSLVVVAAVH